MKKTIFPILILLGALIFTLPLSAQNDKAKKGTFQSLKMPCKLLNGISEREYGIYLPGSYQQESLRQYPVLYLMHGGGGSHKDWENWNHLTKVVNELVSNGTIDDMVIVCPEGNQQNMMYFNATA